MVEDKLLLIVDVQKGFICDKTKHIPSLVEKLQYEYKHVFATRFINPIDSQYRKLIHWSKFTPGSEEIDLAFTPKEGVNIIDKYIYTCVTDTFLTYLETNSIKEVIICGIDTDICVTKCAVDLFEKGYTPIVLKDYCASHAQDDVQEAALIILSRYIGREQVQ